MEKNNTKIWIATLISSITFLLLLSHTVLLKNNLDLGQHIHWGFIVPFSLGIALATGAILTLNPTPFWIIAVALLDGFGLTLKIWEQSPTVAIYYGLFVAMLIVAVGYIRRKLDAPNNAVALQERVNALQEKVAQLQAEKEGFTEKVLALSGKNAQSPHAIEQMVSTLSEKMEQSYRTIEQMVSTLSGEKGQSYRTIEQKVADLSEKYAAEKQKVAHLSEKVTHLSAEKQNLQQKVADLLQKVAGLRVEAKEAAQYKQLTALIAAYESTLTESLKTKLRSPEMQKLHDDLYNLAGMPHKAKYNTTKLNGSKINGNSVATN